MTDYSVRVNFENAQNLVLDVLIEDFENTSNYIDNLKDKEFLDQYEKKELKRQIKIRKALKRTIKYYTVPGAMDSYFEVFKYEGR